ncbi:MAG TPA: TOBE domain-containing protein, partial [Abditibacterium sp.]
GKTVSLGIRPEDIYAKELVAPTANPQAAGQMRVDVIETMGADSTLFLTSGSNTLLATVDAETPAREGELMDVVFDLNRVHIFDKETELTIV